MPSMCEPCDCLTIEKIYTDYCRGITHTSRLTAYYDDGTEIEETQIYDDFADVRGTDVDSLNKLNGAIFGADSDMIERLSEESNLGVSEESPLGDSRGSEIPQAEGSSAEDPSQ